MEVHLVTNRTPPGLANPGGPGIMQCAAWAAVLRAHPDDERVTERTLCSDSARSTLPESPRVQ